MKLAQKILLTLYLFIYIFSPPVMHNTRLVLDVMNFLLFIVYVIYNKKICISHKVRNYIISFLPFVIYIWVNGLYFTLIEAPDTVAVYSDFEFLRTAFLVVYVWIRVALLCFALKLMKDKFNLDIDSFLDLIIIAGLLQFICTLLAFLFPGVRDAFLALIHANTDGAVQKSIFFATKGDQRCYGLSDNLFDSIGYVVSFITTISLIKSLKSRKIKYFIAFFCLVFIAVMNTRTGLVLDFMSAALIMIYYSSGNIIKNAIIYSIGTLVLVLIGMNIVSILPQETSEWLFSGMESIYVLLVNQEYTGIFLDFYLRHLNFPNDLFFGDGAIPTDYNVSDIGYIQCIWYYGCIGTMLVLCAFGYFFYNGYKRNKGASEMQCFILCSAVIFFVYMVKLFSLHNLGGYAVFVPIIIISLFEGNCDGNDCDKRIV